MEGTQDKPVQEPINVDRGYEQPDKSVERAYNFGVTTSLLVLGAIFLIVLIAAVMYFD
jgi:hypothetical protein